MRGVGRWCALGLGAWCGIASAGEPLFGWIYTTDILPAGKREIEQWAVVQDGQSRGDYRNTLLRTEWEYGVSDNYQIATYLNSRTVTARRNGVDGLTGGPDTDIAPGADRLDGYHRARVESVSFENLWRLKNPYTDGYGMALYLEPELGPRVRELEMRLILQKNFLDDRLVVAGNLLSAVERERSSGAIEKATQVDLTAGATYRFADRWSAGLEARNHREFSGYGLGNAEHSAYFLGPNVHYATQDWWMTAAWRHQLPYAQAFNAEQRDVVVGNRIFGEEHTRNEFVLRVGFPLQ